MKNQGLFKQSLASVLLVSFLLQSCFNQTVPSLQGDLVNIATLRNHEVVEAIDVTEVAQDINHLGSIASKPGTEPQFLIAKGGEQVTFQQLPSGQWQAQIKEQLGSFSRELTLPVYLEGNKFPIHLQQKDIHITLPEKSSNQQGYVYIGTWGLQGGMEKEGGNSNSEEVEEEEGEDDFLEDEDPNDVLSSVLEGLNSKKEKELEKEPTNPEVGLSSGPEVKLPMGDQPEAVIVIKSGLMGEGKLRKGFGPEASRQEDPTAKKKQPKGEAQKRGNDSYHQQKGNQLPKQEPIKQNAVSTTSPIILPGAIFHTDSLDNLIVDAINQYTLSSDLYKFRAEKIKAITGKGINALCHKNEIKIINKIVELSQQLPKQLNGKDIQKLKNTCEQIFRLVYKYIFYRVNGIRSHLNTGNVDIWYRKSAEIPSGIYYSSPDWGPINLFSTFKEHKAARSKEIDAYHKKPEVDNALQALYRLAPALFHQPQSMDEYLVETENPFSEPGIKFIEPPFLVELNELIKYVGLVYTNNHAAQTLTDLHGISQKFTAKKDSSHILKLLKTVYIPMECLAFWPPSNQVDPQEEERFLRLCLCIGESFPNIISYDLLEISEERIRQARKTLERPNSTLEDKIQAGRILLYARIPWNLIRNISALLSKSLNSKDLKEETIILEANKTLGSVWQSLLPALQELITFEVSAITQQVNISPNQYPPLNESQYLPLTYLGNYAGDVLFLHKISSTLGELDFKKPFFTETYLRLLGILGECAKELSSHTKKLIGEDYWEKLAKVRDKTAHTTGYLRRMQEILEQKPKLAEALKTELQLLLLQVKNVQQEFPNTWLDIQQFYGQELDIIQQLPSSLGIQLNNLQEVLDPVLTEEDYEALRSTKRFITTGLAEKRDQILKVIDQEIEAKVMEQSTFFALVDEFNSMITIEQRDKIKEVYVKLQQGEKVSLSYSIIKNLQKIKSVTDEEMDNCIELLIKNLKNYDKASVLEKELAKNGLIAAKDIWEEKRKKFFTKVNNKLPKPKSLSNQTWNFDKVLIDSIDAAKNILRLLEALEKLVHSKDTSDMLPLEQFWDDPILCQAVEFHFTRLRIYTDVIQEALGYLPRYDVVHETILALNSLYNSLAIKLKDIRLYGNSLAHLHDVTQFDGRTIHGHRLTAYQELWTALKDYKTLTSIKTYTTQYIEILTATLEAINKDRAAKLDDNRKSYQSAYKWQQQALAKLPNSNLSDFQILSSLSKIDDSDPHKLIKQQLYTATKELVRLHQEFLRLQNVSPIASSAKRSSSATKHANVAGQKLFFQETPIVGDGWCTLNAIGIADPAGVINLLKNQLNNPHIVEYICRAIENSYQASLALGEAFDIVGNDSDNNNIKDKIIALYLNCQNDDPTAHVDMLGYLERPEVQIAYLDYLLKTRYVDSNIAAACLSLQGKKLALFIDYNLPDGQLINSVEDNVSPSDPNAVCLVFHPNSSHSSAHYNLLSINN